MSPPFSIIVLRRARRQIAEASAWWKAHRFKAPDAFGEELARAFELLEVQPDAGAIVADVPGVRRIHLHRVHYYLYYRVTPRAVEIIALWHTSRGSGPGL